MSGAAQFVDKKLVQRPVMLFSKSYSPDSNYAKKILSAYNMSHAAYEFVDIEARQDCTQIENYFQILCLTDTREVSLFIYL